MDEQILIRFSTVAAYDLRMCMKEDNSCVQNIKGHNQYREMIRSVGQGYPFVMLRTILVLSGF